jgi:hypothetical protein
MNLHSRSRSNQHFQNTSRPRTALELTFVSQSGENVLVGEKKAGFPDLSNISSFLSLSGRGKVLM